VVDLRLMIMGLLMKGPAHGYDLKQTLERELSPFFAVSATPLYYTLKKLEQEGAVTKLSTVSGRRPQKYVYHLTAKGQKEIKDLLLKNMTYLHRPSLNLDISLYFLNFLDPEDVVKTLKSRLKELRKLRFVLDRQKKDLAIDAMRKKEYIIMAHTIRVTEAEIDFVHDLIEAFSQGGLDKENFFTKANKGHDRR
jgi:DNA-binding PadR family transcriptional regulator